MWTIQQGPDGWQLLADGQPLGAPCATYGAALALLAAEATAAAVAAEQAAPATSSGLLPDTWHSPGGICFSEDTGDGRDFSGCAWSWRDPAVSLLPLMFQSKTDMGHFGAELAGYIDTLTLTGGTVYAEGHFYDSDQGRAAHDLLLGGRRFGVSVDPGAVDMEWECTEEDEDGWCVAERVVFSAYEVAGLTMTPFPAFARAAIELAELAAAAVADGGHAFHDGGDGTCDVCIAEDDDGACTETCGLTEAEHDSEEAAIAIQASGPTVPPHAWFQRPEPTDPSNPLLVDQGQGRLACPLTITDDGQVFGHMAVWGQCHVGYASACVEPPPSANAYRSFHTGSVLAVEPTGARVNVPTGTLCVGADHAPTEGVSAARAADHYANTGLCWADVRVYDGVHGPWVCGALRPGITPEQVRVLRGSSLSGDWRKLGQSMELVAVLAVNTPGFPIAREALAAAAMPEPVRMPMPRASIVDGQAVALVAAGTVRRCVECGRRAAQGAQGGARRPVQPDLGLVVREAVAAAVAPLAAKLDTLDRRTRHLRAGQAERLRSLAAAGRGNGTV